MFNKKYGRNSNTTRGRTIKQNNTKEKFVIADMIDFEKPNGERKTYITSVYTGKCDGVAYDFVREKELHKAKHYSSKSYAKKRAAKIEQDCEIETLYVVPVSKLKDYDYFNPLPRHLFW